MTQRVQLSEEDFLNSLPNLDQPVRSLSPQDRIKKRSLKQFSASRVFDLYHPSDREDYCRLLEQDAASIIRITHHNQLFDPETRYTYVLWVENYVTYQTHKRSDAAQRLFQAANTRVTTSTPAQALLSTAGQLASELASVIGVTREDEEDEEEVVKETPNYHYECGIFDILDEEDMREFHHHFDLVLHGQLWCETLRIQYDQEKQKIFFIWYDVTKTATTSTQGW